MTAVVRYQPESDNARNQQLHDELDQQIAQLEKEIDEIQAVIDQYTPLRSEYQTVYSAKSLKLSELYLEYFNMLKDSVDAQEQERHDAFKETMEEFASGMGFGESGPRGEHRTEEEFFRAHEKKKQQQKKDNYVKQDMNKVSGKLVEQLQDIPLQKIYRKVGFLLHDDHLKHNPEVIDHPDYYIYLKGLFVNVVIAYEKDDKAGILLALQEAHIEFVDGKFVLPTYAEFTAYVGSIHKKNTIKELEERLRILKTTSVYLFALEDKKGTTMVRLRKLDEEIEHLEDLIASYRRYHD